MGYAEYGIIVILDIHDDNREDLLDGTNLYFSAFQNYLSIHATCLKQDMPFDRREVYQIYLGSDSTPLMYEKQMHHVEFLKKMMKEFDYALDMHYDKAILPYAGD